MLFFVHREEQQMGFPRLQVDEVSEELVEAYCHYELVERRLAELTVINAAYTVRQFLAWRAQTDRGPIVGLEPTELEEFVVHEAGRVKRGSLRSKVGYMRTFVRFLYVTGVTERDLSSSVPWVASGRFDGLPKNLDPSVVAALLGSCNRSRPVGVRDYAIFTLMVRLGLRAIEISRMQLEDVDWRARSWCTARAAAKTACRCRVMWARHWSTTCDSGVPCRLVGHCFWPAGANRQESRARR